MELKIEYLKKEELKPYANNAKIHTAEQVEQIKKSIEEFGFIECEFKVKHDDRELEIIIQQNKIKNFITDKYGLPAMFGTMSCEMIAKEILTYFEGCVSCKVLEDGFGGAEVIR